jgi:23S rRNA (guanosine2251-2'-O)-methyltransferase
MNVRIGVYGYDYSLRSCNFGDQSLHARMKKLKLEELGRISVDEFKSAEKLSVCLVLDNVRSLHNVGSAFRTADAFRIEKIYLTGITGTPPHREIHKTALGATESVPWEYFEQPAMIVKKLGEEGYKIIVVEQTTTSTPLQKFEPSQGQKYCLVFGNEVNGVSDEVLEFADMALEIPQEGTKHSLNISVCLGIVVWEIFRKTVLTA